MFAAYGRRSVIGVSESELDAVVVGAGFAGLYMLHRLRQSGVSARVYEAGAGVGGTWYWNRYPGARCDVESVEYSYGFDADLQREWEWTERYPGQPEILRYLEHVADRFDLRRDMVFNTRVTATTWDATAGRWRVTTDSGEAVSARFVIMATGCLSSANIPAIDGIESFAGATYHTGQWPHEGVDFTGQRVGVIGTGSSAVQSIPVIAQEAAQVVVFQRTATYSVPAHNRPLDPGELAAVKADYAALRARQRASAAGFSGAPPETATMSVDDATRAKIFEERWERGGLTFLGAFTDLIIDPNANEAAADFVKAKIRSIVQDPAVADRLMPSQVIGCKRLCIDTGYYETFNLPHVRLVDINAAPIEAITARGVRAGGEEVALDAIVFATGFDAMTGSLLKIDITGRDGLTLREAWSEGPRTYLGLGTPGFPNLFTVTGPGSPSVLTNMVVSIEHHVEWIGDCIDHLRSTGQAIEAESDAAANWVTYVNSVADLTLFPTCSSWYLGANIPGKPRVFMPLPGFEPYAAQCAHVAVSGYPGFALT
jgi:cation diffusion facilitator CzcD-associated flavoprotein CzcO